MVPCEIYLCGTPFVYETIFKYNLDLPQMGKKFCFTLMYDDDLTIPCILDTIPNSLADNQLKYQAKKKIGIIEFDGEEPITSKDALDEIQWYQYNKGNSKVSINLCKK